MKSPLLYLGVGLVLVLFTALIAPMFIDWSNYRAEFERYGSKLAGREVRIEGPVRIQILPSPIISIGGLRIANAEGATAETFVSADSLEMRVALTPLLKGQIEVQSLRFDGAIFEFEHMQEAGGNWQLSPKVGWADFLSADNIGVASATISDSTIVLRDRGRRGVAHLDDVDLEVAAASLAGPFRVKGTVLHEEMLLYVSVQTGRRIASGDMRLSVTLEPEGEYTPVYGFDGKVVGAGDDARLEGRLQISRDLPALVEDEQPLNPAEVGLPFSFKSEVTAGFSEISLTGIEFLVDQAQPGSVVEGELRVNLGDTIGFDVGLSARHLDLDRIAERAGLTPADLVPGLELVDKVAEFVAAAPDDLKGRFRLAANALTIGGETVEGAAVSAHVDGKSLAVANVGGVLPGRSELQLSGLTFAIRSGIPGFEGDVTFTSDDTRGFLNWALPGIADTLNAAPRAFKGTSKVTGRIALDGRSVGIRQAEAYVDGTTVQGAVVIVPGRMPEILSNLTMGDVDFDRYFPVAGPDDVSSMSADPFASLFSGIEPSHLAAFNGKFALRTGPFRRWGLKGDALEASIEVRDGTLVVQQGEIQNFNGANLALVGAVDWRGGAPRGSLTADVETGQMRRLLRIPPLRRVLQADVRALDDFIREADPVNVHIDLDSEERDGANRIAATVEGQLGSATIQFTAVHTGDWSRFREGHLKLNGIVSSEGSDMLTRLFGLALPAGAAAADTSMLSISLAGTPAKGLGAALMAEVLDTKLEVTGLITEVGGDFSVESEVIVKSDDASELLHAFRLLPNGEPANPIAIDVKGLVSGGGDEIIVTGLGGRVAGVPVGLDGTVNLSGPRPGLFGNVTVAEIDLPWIVSRALSLPHEPSTGADRGAGASEAAWSAEPFDFGYLNAVDLNLALRAGDVKLMGNATGSQLQAEITIAGGAVTVERFTSVFAGGKLHAHARLGAADGQLSIQADFNLENAEFASTLRPRQGQAPLSGRYTLVGQLKGAGRSPIGFVSSLSGDGTLSIDEAALQGINPITFSEALQQANSASELDGIIADTLVDGQMDFAGFTSAFELNNGVVRFARAEIDGPAAKGSVDGMLDLPAWHLDSKWTIALKTFPTAPTFTVLLAGPAAELVRSYDTTALRSFFVVKGLTEGVQRLEKLQREEEERIKRLEEMEREAKLRQERREAERREAERLEALRLEAERQEAERRRKAEEAARAAREAEEAERLARQNSATEPPSQTGTIEQPTVVIPLPEVPNPKPNEPKAVTRRILQDGEVVRLPLHERVAPAEELPVDELPTPEVLQPVQNFDQPASDDLDVDVLALEPLDPVTEDGGEDGPVDITPGTGPASNQENVFSDDPASWRK